MMLQFIHSVLSSTNGTVTIIAEKLCPAKTDKIIYVQCRNYVHVCKYFTQSNSYREQAQKRWQQVNC